LFSYKDTKKRKSKPKYGFAFLFAFIFLKIVPAVLPLPEGGDFSLIEV